MIAEMVARLQSQIPELKLVGGAAEFQAASESNPKAAPAVFVFTADENPGRSPDVPMVIQRVAVRVSVVWCIKNVADATGSAGAIDMDALRSAGKAALLGWQPEPGCDPLERGPGRLLMFRDGYQWWQDIWLTTYFDKEM